MNTHDVTLIVRVRMDEMDGSPEQSAEIALNLVSDAIHTAWDADADVSVSDYGEAGRIQEHCKSVHDRALDAAKRQGW